MVLSNAPKRVTRSANNVNFSGGSKKAGLPYQVGRPWTTSIALGHNNPGIKGFSCCSLTSIQEVTDKMKAKKVCAPHPPGRWMGGKRC